MICFISTPHWTIIKRQQVCFPGISKQYSLPRASTIAQQSSQQHPDQSEPSFETSQSSSSISSQESYNDQWSQHAHRDSKLDKELNSVRQIPQRQRHIHIFFQSFAQRPFSTAAARFVTQARKNTKTRTKRVWFLRAVPDPTFGDLRGEPYPPRCSIITDPENANDGSDIYRWVAALNRSGPALTPMDSHHVDWALRAAHVAKQHTSPPMENNWLIAFEILNANWVNASAVGKMRDHIIAHGRQVVDDGYASSFEVLQSVDEPTCLKTMEVYPSLDHLRKCLDNLDEPYATRILTYRAAVNRVRQLHQCIGHL